MTDNKLLHYGILGMRWGRRKASSSSGGSSRSKKPRIEDLSNDELKALVTRLSLEKQYKDITKKELSAGQKYVLEILAASGKAEATKYATKAMDVGMDVAIKQLRKRIAKRGGLNG